MKTKSQSETTTRTNKTAFITGAVGVAIAVVPFLIKLFTDNGTDFAALVAGFFALELFYFLVLAVVRDWKLDSQIAKELNRVAEKTETVPARKAFDEKWPVATPPPIAAFHPTPSRNLQVGALKATYR
jgi:hypothetical protein